MVKKHKKRHNHLVELTWTGLKDLIPYHVNQNTIEYINNLIGDKINGSIRKCSRVSIYEKT